MRKGRAPPLIGRREQAHRRWYDCDEDGAAQEPVTSQSMVQAGVEILDLVSSTFCSGPDGGQGVVRMARSAVTDGATVVVLPAEAHTTGLHDNCTNFNNRYPHGVGRRGAHDRGGDVTNFKRSNRIYNRAERHNGDLDRDNDRIACEKG